MNCNCVRDNESRIAEHYTAALGTPATAEAKNVGFLLGAGVSEAAYLPYAVKADKPGFRGAKGKEISMFFSFCPFCGKSTKEGIANISARAFEIADESMVELLVSHSVRGDALAPTYGLSDAEGREVRALEDADLAIQEAFEWLAARGLAELVEGEVDTSIALKGHALEFVGI